MITQKLLKELFTYRDDGTFIKNKNGKIVKCSETEGQRYLRIGINGKPYRLHRMIYLYHHGYLPEIIDHIDGNKDNNDPSNYQTLCANCHRLKTYQNKDWENKKRAAN